MYLILAVANKDGGANVDPVLDKKYANLSRGNTLTWRFFARNREDSVVYKAMLRKIGVQVVSTSERTDNTPTGRLMEAIIESLVKQSKGFTFHAAWVKTIFPRSFYNLFIVQAFHGAIVARIATWIELPTRFGLAKEQYKNMKKDNIVDNCRDNDANLQPGSVVSSRKKWVNISSFRAII